MWARRPHPFHYTSGPTWVCFTYQMSTLNQGWFCLPGEIWQWSETILIVTTVGAIGIWWVEAKDTDKHVSMQRTAPLSKELSSQKCHPRWGRETLHSTSIQEFAWKMILQLNRQTTGVNKSTDAAACCFLQGKSGHKGWEIQKTRAGLLLISSIHVVFNTILLGLWPYGSCLEGTECR